MKANMNLKEVASGKIPRWEKFKHFFQITYFRYLVLWFTVVPLLVSLLKGLPSPLEFFIADKHISMALGLPFSWQLLWLSSFFFLAAYVLYLIRCPSFIKEYNRYSDYLAYAHDPRWLAWVAGDLVRDNKQAAKLVERLIVKSYLTKVQDETEWKKRVTDEPVVGAKTTTLYFKSGTTLYALAMPKFSDSCETNVDEGAERGIFWEIFGRYSGIRIWSRVVILFFLLSSLICFSIVFFQHVGEGFCDFLIWGAKYSWLTDIGRTISACLNCGRS
jgi:hypothetical protein